MKIRRATVLPVSRSHNESGRLISPITPASSTSRSNSGLTEGTSGC